jgi:uncharacterized protein (TIGR02246 family)
MQNHGSQPAGAAEEAAVRELFRELLDCWNRRDAAGFAELFEEDGFSVGFDGSQMDGRAEIAAAIGEIFADHVTAAYVGKIRTVRFLAPEVALLRAVSGMVPPGQSDLNPATNTVQSLIAVGRGGRWQIAGYQNTPAQFHGRPWLAEALTDELRQVLSKGRPQD